MKKQLLNRAQNAMYMMHCVKGMSGLFNNAECLEFSGKVNEPILRKSIRYCAAECEVLSGFYRADESFQPYLSEANIEVEIVSCNIPEVTQAKSFFVNWAIERVSTPFDLASELPLRFYLCRSPTKDYLVTVGHHICLDGFGFMLFFGRIGEVYGALATNNPMLPVCKYRPLDALISHEQEKAQNYEQAGLFWQQSLADWSAPVSFKPLGKAITRKNIRHSSVLDSEHWNACLLWANKHKVSPADLLFALIFLALYRHTGQTKLSIGMIAMQRFGNPSINIPCLQINTVPLLVDINQCDNFIALAKAVSLFKRKCRKYSDYRSEDLRRDSQRSYRREPFGPLVNILPFHHGETFGELQATTHNLASGAVEDLMVQAYISDNTAPRIDLDANANSYPMSGLRSIAVLLNELLVGVSTSPEKAL